MSEITKLIERKKEIKAQGQAIIDLAKKEERNLTPDEITSFDKVEADIKDIDGKIDIEERALRMANIMIDETRAIAAAANPNTPPKQAEGGSAAPTTRAEANDLLKRDIISYYKGEKRALDQPTQNTVESVDGGVLVPELLAQGMIEVMQAQGGLMSVVNLIRTSTGAPITYPKTDYTAEKGALIGETEEDTLDKTQFGSIMLNAYGYTSNVLRISWELLQDSQFDIYEHVLKVCNHRIERAIAEHILTGDGTDKPKGILTGLTLKHTGTGTIDDWYDLEALVDPAYRSNARFVLSSSQVTALKKLSANTNNPTIWQPSLRDGEQSRIIGYAYTEDNDLASQTEKVLFGDFSKYYLRHAGDFTLSVFRELFGLKREVGLALWGRFDGEMADDKAIAGLTI